MAQLNEVPTPRLQAIRNRAKELPQGNFIISIDNPKEHTTAGKVFVVDARKAAECEYDMTHRLCTPEEVEAYLKNEEKMRETIINRERARRANFNINVQTPQPVYVPQYDQTPAESHRKMQQFADVDLKDTSDSKGLPKKVK